MIINKINYLFIFKYKESKLLLKKFIKIELFPF